MDTIGTTFFVLLFCSAVYVNDLAVTIIGFLGVCYGIYEFNKSKKIDLMWQEAAKSGREVDIAIAELEKVKSVKKELESLLDEARRGDET